MAKRTTRRKNRTRAFRHVVWDWNGTLLDDTAACVESLNAMLKPLSLGPVTLEEYREKFGFPVYDYYVRLGVDFKVTDWNALADEFHRHYAVYGGAVGLRRGVRAALEAIALAGIEMSVLSAAEETSLVRMLKSRSVDKFFKAVYARSDFFADSKITAGRRMAAAVGGDPATVLLVGDTDHDWLVARELGFRCVLVTGGHQSEHRLRACGCEVLGDVAEVAGYVTEGHDRKRGK